MFTWTTPRLNNELDIAPQALGAFLRRTYGVVHGRNTGRELTGEMVEAACDHFVSTEKVDRLRASRVLETFQKEQEAADDERQPSGAENITPPLPRIDGTPPEYQLRSDESAVRSVAATIFDHMRHGGSLFVDENVWTRSNLDVLIERFVETPDTGGNSFQEKLRKQLTGTGSGPVALFVEIFLLQMLPIKDLSAATKRNKLNDILAIEDMDRTIPPNLLSAFDNPIFRGGQAFNSRRFQQLSVIIRFVRYFWELPPERQSEAFEDPFVWKNVMLDSPGTPERSIRASLSYLAYPDYFFPIVSDRHKRSIVEAFFPAYTHRPPSGNPDFDLATLRQWMKPPEGTTPNFYKPPLEEIWRPANDPETQQDAGALADPESAESFDAEDDSQYDVGSILAEGGFHPAAELRGIVERWKEAFNIVLQGAPGTGKTWLAKRLAYVLIGQKRDAAIRSVQFHPGTSYEDFVRGWRPDSDGRLTLVDGPLMQHADRARKDPETPHVLIIEEFNRGNPAQALGEMLTLLEATKRTEADALELTYMRPDEQPVWLPENLFIIGTMNTADRSLALVDFALRRRFAFFDLAPQFGASWEDHVVARFPGEDRSRVQEIGRRILELNTRIADDVSLGPSFRIGHSYLTPTQQATDLEPWYRSVVESSIRPQLTEYWYENAIAVDEAVGTLLRDL